MPETRYKSLSPKRRLLLDLIRSVRFGEIQDLKIRTGEPVLHPLPRMIRTVRFGSDSGAGPDSDNSNPVLKRQVLEMLQNLTDCRMGRSRASRSRTDCRSEWRGRNLPASGPRRIRVVRGCRDDGFDGGARSAGPCESHSG